MVRTHNHLPQAPGVYRTQNYGLMQRNINLRVQVDSLISIQGQLDASNKNLKHELRELKIQNLLLVIENKNLKQQFETLKKDFENFKQEMLQKMTTFQASMNSINYPTSN